VSHATSNVFEKSNKRIIGASVINFLTSSKALVVAESAEIIYSSSSQLLVPIAEVFNEPTVKSG